MSQQILQQPDGRLAVFSSVVDSFILVDATEDEIIEWRAEEAAEKAREATRRELDRVLRGVSDPGFRSRLTWDEALRRDQSNTG